MTRRRVLLLALFAAATLQACACRPDRHRTACGPVAVSAAVARLGLPPVEPADVSRQITRPGGLQAARGVLALVCPEAASITWPRELEASLRRHGIRAETVEGSHAELLAEAARIELAGGTGVVLVRDRCSPLVGSYHYMAFGARGSVLRCERYHWGGSEFVRLYRCRRPSPPSQ